MSSLRSPASASVEQSRGRLIAEPAQEGRSDFQRDRERVLHSAAFRRLAHKTQVFVGSSEGDHVRTRLTHTIEVAQIARDLARRLNLNEDLAETVALAHDLGHPPFGHAGEDALDDALKPWGGFDHNAQALDVVTRLEHRYPDFDGLNLCFETVEGIMAHNGPLYDADGAWLGKHQDRSPPASILRASELYGIDLKRHATAEAQCAAIADDIAYDCHDIEDGVRSGILDPDRLQEVPLLNAIWSEVDLDRIADVDRRVHQLLRRLMFRLVSDVLTTSRERLSGISSCDEVRDAGQPVIVFSTKIATDEKLLKEWLRVNLYRHQDLVRETERGKSCVRQLVDILMTDPHLLPARWSQDLDSIDEAALAIRIRDYVSGMTDRYAFSELEKLNEMTRGWSRTASPR